MKEEAHTPTYRGNKIPLPIKIVWALFVVWLAIYLLSYSLPDLKMWLSR